MKENENVIEVRPINAKPVSSLKGVGPVVSARMAGKGLKSVDDLLYFLPIRWLDRTTIKTIAELKPGDECSVIGSVDSYRSMFFRNSRKKGFEMVLADATGYLSLKWFQWSKSYLQRICKKGVTILASGKIARYGEMLEIIHPDVTIVDDVKEADSKKRTVVPVYSQIEGVKQGVMRNIIGEAVAAGEPKFNPLISAVLV